MSPLAGSRQLLRVIAADWTSCSGELQCLARDRATAAWRPVGAAIPVSLGRGGLAWGHGRHGDDEFGGRRKREGDGCAPAGIFAITGLFGTATVDSDFARKTRLPYLATHGDLQCIDDPASRHYNRIVDRRDVDGDWQSHEAMRRDDERYAVGAVIAHNSDPVRAGAGSCIFLHVWSAPGVPTAGCTAGAHDDIAALCAWLDADCAPLLVQLPLAEYLARRPAWALPDPG